MHSFLSNSYAKELCIPGFTHYKFEIIRLFSQPASAWLLLAGMQKEVIFNLWLNVTSFILRG
jgi:hypothetical protein